MDTETGEDMDSMDERTVTDSIMEDGLRITPVKYQVTMIPEDMEADGGYLWEIKVEYRGRGLYAVLNSMNEALSSSGEWDWEPGNSSRTDDWNAAHRFTLNDALALAQDHARTWKSGTRFGVFTAEEFIQFQKDRR